MSTTNDTPLPEAGPLLTTVETARYLRLSAATLERLRLTGDGPRYIKLGPGKRARIVYPINDLETWLRANTRTHTTDRGQA